MVGGAKGTHTDRHVDVRHEVRHVGLRSTETKPNSSTCTLSSTGVHTLFTWACINGNATVASFVTDD